MGEVFAISECSIIQQQQLLQPPRGGRRHLVRFHRPSASSVPFSAIKSEPGRLLSLTICAQSQQHKPFSRGISASAGAGGLVSDSKQLQPDSTGGGGGDGNSNGGGGGGSEESEDNNNKMAFSMSQKLTLAYAALVGVGGVMGYLKSGSQKSLMAGGLSALLLYYVHTQLPTSPVLASSLGLGLSAALLGVMGSRFKKSGKIFPAGVMSFVSLVMSGGYLHGILRSMH